MGIGKNEFNFLLDPLNSRLNGLKLKKLLPLELRQALISYAKTIGVIDDEEASLGQLNSIQKGFAAKPILSEKEPQNPLFDPETIGVKEDIEALVAANILPETTSTSIDESKQALSEDKPTEKPQLTFGQMLVPFVLPGPLGTLVNVVAQQGNATKEENKEESQSQGTGAESGTDEGQSEKQTRTGFWDRLSSGFAKLFETITKPLAVVWNDIKKQIGVEKFAGLFNNKFDLKQSTQEAKRLQELASNKQIADKAILEKEIIAKEIEKQNILARFESERQLRLAQEAKANEARLAQEAEARQVALVALTEKQREEAENLEAKLLEENSTSKLSISDSPKAKRAIASGLHLDLNKLSSNATESDLNTLIEQAMIESPGAAFAYLYSMGKDLYALSNNTMFRSNDSANMINVLANYINSGSDPTIAPKDVYLAQQQQGPTSLSKA